MGLAFDKALVKECCPARAAASLSVKSFPVSMSIFSTARHAAIKSDDFSTSVLSLLLPLFLSLYVPIHLPREIPRRNADVHVSTCCCLSIIIYSKLRFWFKM